MRRRLVSSYDANIADAYRLNGGPMACASGAGDGVSDPIGGRVIGVSNGRERRGAGSGPFIDFSRRACGAAAWPNTLESTALSTYASDKKGSGGAIGTTGWLRATVRPSEGRRRRVVSGDGRTVQGAGELS